VTPLLPNNKPWPTEAYIRNERRKLDAMPDSREKDEAIIRHCQWVQRTRRDDFGKHWVKVASQRLIGRQLQQPTPGGVITLTDDRCFTELKPEERRA
jgi:hypothetical protein